MRYFRIFNHTSAYTEYMATEDAVTPNISYCIMDNKTYVTPSNVPPTPHVDVTGVTLDVSEVTISQGSSRALVATVLPNNATDKSVTWSSSDSNVATVSQNGFVTAVAIGDCIITVTTNDGDYTASCEVTVTEYIDYSKEYLTFKVLTGGTIVWKASSTSVTRNISYSKDDGVTWTEITSSTDGTVIDVSTGDKVLIKGNHNRYATTNGVKSSFASGGTAYYNVEGNIMSLVSGDNFTKATSFTGSHAFHSLFDGSNVVSAENLILPVKTLNEGCYRAMFANATSLTKAPVLSSTTLGQYCYAYMFFNCTNLTTAPELPALTLATSAYTNMFQGCISLTTAPELPATTLANNCYQGMFSGCTNLVTPPSVLYANDVKEYSYHSMFKNCTKLATAPEIRATSLDLDSCQEMFAYCTSLVVAPELAATTFNNKIGSYWDMFIGCTGLTTPPSVLPATKLNSLTYCGMFQNCTSLSATPIISATTVAPSSCKSMFQGCTSLTTVASTLPATTLATNCYFSMFNGCTSLTTAPSLTATTLAESACTFMFSGCTNLTTAPSLPATTLANDCYRGMFAGCAKLTTAPSLPATTLATRCYRDMFFGCTSLTTAPSLPATTMEEECCRAMFYNCTSLTVAPSLPATTLATYCYHQIFYNCTSLTTAPRIYATTLATSACTSMFAGCTSLTTAPELLATTLADYCYHSMFSGCTSLTTAPELSATTLVDSCYNNMFRGCSSLNNITALFTTTPSTTYTSNWVNGVAANGTFYKNNEAQWDVRGINGIPTNWNVLPYNITHVTGVTLNTGSTEVIKGNTFQLTATVSPNDAYVKSVTWTTSDNTVATVDSNGLITAVGCGNATITVTTTDGGYTAQCATTVINPVTGISLNTNVLTILTGGTYQLTPILTPSDACGDTSVNWASSNSSIASVSNNGLVTAVAIGSAVITATTTVGNYTATCAVEVAEAVSVTSVTLNESTLSLAVGDTSTLTATVEPSDATDKSVSWTSSNNNIVTVDSNGVVTAVGDGDATITVTTNVGACTASCNVTVTDYTTKYFTIESLEDENDVYIRRLSGSVTANTEYYSLDNGTNWTAMTSGTGSTKIATIDSGDKILVKCTTDAWATEYNKYSGFYSSKKVKVYGNVMSLLYGDNFATATTINGDFALAGLFFGSNSGKTFSSGSTYDKLISAKNLVLPATTITKGCYNGMFRNCSGMTEGPRELPAITIYQDTYGSMFEGCRALAKAPDIKATTIDSTSNTGCMARMFCMSRSGSTSAAMTSGPILRITSVHSKNAYRDLFRGNSSLTEVTILATSIYTGSDPALNNWLTSVNSSGVINKYSSLSLTKNSTSGIPSGWSTEDITV